MLSSETKIVTYVNKKGERSTYPLNSAMESANLEMVKRLKYTKDILTHMLNTNTAMSATSRPATQGGDPTAVGSTNTGGIDGSQAQTVRPQTTQQMGVSSNRFGQTERLNNRGGFSSQLDQ